VDLLHKGIYKNLLLSLTDEVDEAVKTITDFQQMIGKQNV
jgi:hypothetical protein